MLWGWEEPRGRGQRTGAWARAPLIPRRESASYQRLPASLEHPAVLGGLGERRTRQSLCGLGSSISRHSGPCLGQGAPQAVSFSLRLCVSSSHAHTEAHVRACVSTRCAAACVGSSLHHQFLPLFAHPPPENLPGKPLLQT